MRKRSLGKKLKYLIFSALLVLAVTAATGCAQSSRTGTADTQDPLPTTPLQVEVQPVQATPTQAPEPTQAPVLVTPTEAPEEPVSVSPTPAPPEYVVVLDPGHGGSFTGAVHGLVEKDVVLKIANYAKEYLEANYPQLEVRMTRETDKDFDSQLAKDLENRVQLGKEMGADIFVSFHLNASVAHNIQGAEVLCPHRENVKDDAFRLANCILDELAALGIKRRGIVTKKSNDTVDSNGNPVEYYAINRHAANRDMVGIIIEHCFMDHETDKTYLADDEALRRLGEADARGIAAYFGY